jgi:hypothetical protein
MAPPPLLLIVRYEEHYPLPVVHFSQFLFSFSATKNLQFLLPARSMVENWFLIFCEDHSLDVSRSRGQRRTLGLTREEETGDWRKLHNELLWNLFSSEITELQRIMSTVYGRVHKFKKNRKHLQILGARRVTRNKLTYWGPPFLQWPVHLAFWQVQVKWNVFLYVRVKITEKPVALNLWQHRTEFSHLADHAPGICAPLVHCHSRDWNFGYVHRLRLQ